MGMPCKIIFIDMFHVSKNPTYTEFYPLLLI